MNPDIARQERNRYTIFNLTLAYTACVVALVLENVIDNWELWAIPFLAVSVIFVWWIHLKQPFTERGRVYVLAAVFYAITFYQGVHESSLFDISLIMCFVFFMFSLADVTRVYDIGLIVYFATILYQLIVNYGIYVFSDTLTMSRVVLHILIVTIASRFAKSMINGRQRAAEIQGKVMGQMAEMNRRTEDFMANVSHEFRTPINAVTGLSSIMIERGEGGEEMNSIYRAGHRLSEQVGDILDYSEIDTGRVILSPEIYGVYSIINDVITTFRVGAQGKTLDEDSSFMPYAGQGDGVDLIIDVDASVPARLRGDARRLKKMLWHLVDNAFKFTSAGGVYVHVTADRRGYGVNLCVEVSDTGRGIQPDELIKISRGYYQADSGRTRNAGGMGLGLSIVYGFAHAMGGFVTINSVPGQGTTVKFTVPQSVVDAQPCMSVEEPEKLGIACYLKAEKFKVPMVRDYYEAMITNLVKGLHVPLRRASSLTDLKTIAEQMSPTHVFTAREEYEEDPGFFESLAASALIIVVADSDFRLPVDSSVTILRKPFYGFPIAGILNALNLSGEVEAVSEEVHVSFPGLKVLTVDDEEMNLVVANGIFRGYGMDVTTALSGKEAIEIYESEDFDVVFMDHMMPEMDGVEAMKLMRQTARSRGRGTRFVALTANAVSGAREMFLSEGFDGFIPKPVETLELERVLKAILPSSKVKLETDDTAKSSDSQMKSLEGEELGVSRCLGDRDFYIRLCRIFVEEMPHNLRVFRSAFATGTMEPYGIRLRSLRDGARIIGEDTLARQARRMEQAIEEKDAGRIQREHTELCETYEQTVRRVRSMVLKEGDAS